MITTHSHQIEFSLEALTEDLWMELYPLFIDHFKEISSFSNDMTLSPDMNLYLDLQIAGILYVFIIRDNKKIIGYNFFFVRRHQHFNSLHASQDLIYLQKNYRGRLIGRDFINWCDCFLKEIGTKVVYSHVNSKHNFGPMLEKNGYELIDYVYAKRL